MQKPQKLAALTSLRFFAAAMIVLVHINSVFGALGLVELLPLDQGVSFFFVLSGFILAYNYPVFSGEADILMFLKARIARIYPNHIAAIAIFILLTAHLNVGRHLPTASFAAVANLFLFQSLIPIRKVFFSFNPVAWSISAEMFFYFIFPWLIAKDILTWRFKLTLLVAIVLLYIWFVAAWQIPYDRMDLQSASVEGLIYINPIVRVLEFFSGVLAYFVFTRLKERVDYSTLIFTGLEIVVVLLTLLIMYYSMRLPLDQSNDFARILGFYCAKSGSFPIFAVLIITFAFGKGWLGRFLALKPMVLLGEISFALYLLHRTVLQWYQLHIDYFKAVPTGYMVPAYWLLALLLSFLLHKSVENPCRKLLIALPDVSASAGVKILLAGRQGMYALSLIVLLIIMIMLP